MGGSPIAEMDWVFVAEPPDWTQSQYPPTKRDMHTFGGYAFLRYKPGKQTAAAAYTPDDSGSTVSSDFPVFIIVARVAGLIAPLTNATPPFSVKSSFWVVIYSKYDGVFAAGHAA